MKKELSILMAMGLALIITTTSVIAKAKPVNKVHLNKTGKIYKEKLNVTIKYSLAELSKNIEYDFAKASVRNAYTTKLDQLAQILIKNKSAVALRGFADSIGTYKGNWVLSEKRANAVKNYLIKKGVDSDKIVATPFGSTQPVATNRTAAGRQKNRRVEIKVNE
ncbi:OmpA family protein [Mucilaginibacter sp. UYCu711]|uniref:OmpA family protein n=1 Tax=Mucilaginibacter sp. UYCu711 TaxID=3156339 RepID=UPI003D1D9514